MCYGAAMKQSDLPESVCETLNNEPASCDRATLIDEGVHYDTDRARCIGWEQEGTTTRMLYRGDNDHCFERRIEQQEILPDHSAEDHRVLSMMGALLGFVLAMLILLGSMALPGQDGTVSFRVLVTIYLASCAIGVLGLPLHFAGAWVRNRLMSDPPMEVEDTIEPRSMARLVAQPSMEAEHALRRTLRSEAQTHGGPTGTVSVFPDGSCVYRPHEQADAPAAEYEAAYDDREALQSVIEQAGDRPLYESLFGETLTRA